MYQGIQNTRRNFKRRRNEELQLPPDVKVKVEEADPTSAESVQDEQERLQRVMKIRNTNKSTLNNDAGNKGRIKTGKFLKIKLEKIEEEEAVAVNTPPDVKVKVEVADPTSAEPAQDQRKRLQRVKKGRNTNKSSLNNDAGSGNKGRIKTEQCVKIKLETIEEEAVAVNTPKKIKLARRVEYLHDISSILFPGDVSSSNDYSLYNFNLACRFCEQNSDSILHSERNLRSSHKSDCACVNCDQMVASDPLLQHHLNKHLPPSCHHSQQQFQTEQPIKENNPPKTFHQIKNEDLESFEESPGNSLSDSDSSAASSSSFDSMLTLQKLNENVHYDCKTCQRIFPNELFLNIHEKTHVSQKSHHCSFCTKRFYSDLNLQVHLLIHKKSFSCTHCPRRFLLNAGLKLHNKTCHTDRKVNSISMRRNPTKTRKPQNKTNKKKCIFQCSFCEKKFNWKSNLNDHARIHTGEKPFKCSVCKKDFNKKSNLNNHMIIHTEEKPFKCSVCKKEFNQKTNLNYHLRIHTGEKPFKCLVCKKTFNGKSNLNRHIRIHTGKKLFKCSVCKKGFNTKSDLNQHVRIHTGEKPFNCSVCKKDFNGKSDLNRHMRIHTGEKPFNCSVCKKDFNTKSNLNRHVRIHTREKPFKCSVCKKDFNTKSHLNVHMRIHTGEKLFKCSVCKKDFNMKSNLNVHMRIHTGEKLFKCSVCKKDFNQKSNLNRHFRIHT